MPTSISPQDASVQYSRLTGFIYVFNLIVGTGALTLPAAFRNAGWGLSIAVLIMLAFMSYLTTTFMIESMAAANAILKWRKVQAVKRSETVSTDGPGIFDTDGVNSSSSELDGNESDQHPAASNIENIRNNANRPSLAVISAGDMSNENEPLLGRHDDDDDEDDVTVVQRRPRSSAGHHSSTHRVASPISSYYNITEIIEMGKMSALFFNKFGRTLFYLCIAIYLYGDLAIYAAAVSKSLRDVACTYKVDNNNTNTSADEQPCWENSDISRINAYRVALSVFIAIVGPFGFFNVTKTKYLQMLTTLMRWFAFIAMITLACIRLGDGIRASPPVANLSGVPNLFGVCVYSFMCHHSLPSLVTPITKKRNINWLIATDFLLVLMFYTLLAFTGVFAFDELNDLYTLNFQPIPGEPWYMAAIHYFLSLFPVFTLSTNFPIITITLRNNLKALFLTEGRRYSWWTRHCMFPLLALIPPVGVAFATNSLEFLVGITGSYAGAGIQYVVPAFLVYFSRKTTQAAIGIGVINHHRSWFHSSLWVIFVQAWALACVVLVTWNHISNAVANE